MIFKYIKEFYDTLFKYHYNKQARKSSDPEVFPVAYIAILQTGNLFSIMLIFFKVLHLQDFFSLKELIYSILVVYFLMLALNFYIFVINKRRDAILNDNKELPKNFKRISFIYEIISFWLPFILIYLINEVW